MIKRKLALICFVVAIILGFMYFYYYSFTVAELFTLQTPSKSDLLPVFGVGAIISLVLSIIFYIRKV